MQNFPPFRIKLHRVAGIFLENARFVRISLFRLGRFISRFSRIVGLFFFRIRRLIFLSGMNGGNVGRKNLNNMFGRGPTAALSGRGVVPFAAAHAVVVPENDKQRDGKTLPELFIPAGKKKQRGPDHTRRGNAAYNPFFLHQTFLGRRHRRADSLSGDSVARSGQKKKTISTCRKGLMQRKLFNFLF